MKANVVETITGAIVIVVAIAFFVFAYQTAGLNASAGGYEIKARFATANGLARGSDVRLSGIKVGSIVDMTLDSDNYDAIVTMAVDPNVRLTTDSGAAITSDGLLGGAYIRLEPGGGETMLAAGDTIELTHGAVNLVDLIGKAVFGGNE